MSDPGLPNEETLMLQTSTPVAAEPTSPLVTLATKEMIGKAVLGRPSIDKRPRPGEDKLSIFPLLFTGSAAQAPGSKHVSGYMLGHVVKLSGNHWRIDPLADERSRDMCKKVAAQIVREHKLTVDVAPRNASVLLH
ncbi:MAG TPA: hypothetical protein VGP13_01655 [Candidatus Paceibacterota bacterium]|nr:hypothetical protein [Candidatus Paceibacterota bacterium]